MNKDEAIQNAISQCYKDGVCFKSDLASLAEFYFNAALEWAATGQEPVSSQFKHQVGDGWGNFTCEKHKQDTIAAGYKVRNLYEHAAPRAARTELNPAGPEDTAIYQAISDNYNKPPRVVPEQDAQDAKRYRWLRDYSVPPHLFYLSVPDEFKDQKFNQKDVDAYIDEAILTFEKQYGVTDE